MRHEGQRPGAGLRRSHREGFAFSVGRAATDPNSCRFAITTNRPALLAEVANMNGPFGGDFTSPSNDLSVPSMSNDGGAIATGVPVQLIFWGDAWNQPSTSPSAAELTAAVKSVLAGPFM